MFEWGIVMWMVAVFGGIVGLAALAALAWFIGMLFFPWFKR